MLDAVVAIINEQLHAKVFHLRQFTNHKLYRIAEQAFRSTDNALLPYIPNSNTYVGVDDRSPAIVYHRSSNMSVTGKKPGFGDNRIKEVLTFAMQLIIFQNSFATKMTQDELMLYVMAAFPDTFRIQNFDYISVQINSVILNSQQVWRAEFPGTPYNLNEHQSLMAINYSIESEFKQNCFNSCPEV